LRTGLKGTISILIGSIGKKKMPSEESVVLLLLPYSVLVKVIRYDPGNTSLRTLTLNSSLIELYSLNSMLAGSKVIPLI